MNFPIETLNYSVSESLSNLDLVFKTVTEKGLHNEIILIERNDGHCVYSEIDENGQVYLSPSFCQFVWNISYAALIITDTFIILRELEKQGIKKDMFLQAITKYEGIPEVDFLISELNAMPIDLVLRSGYNCYKKNITSETQQFLQNIDLSSVFSQKVNGLYKATITFVLLHELYHWERDHFNRVITRIEMEREADSFAFDTILKSFCGKEKKTYTIGAMCVFCSFFFMNPTFNNDGTYPYEDERLFSQFDKLTSPEMDACRSIVINIIKTWALYFSVRDFPLLTGYDAIDIETIRKFLKTYNR